MYNSRNVNELRPDVADNCKIFIDLCTKAGLPVLITGTVRDAEYQRKCFEEGTAKTKVPSFHAVGVGLAFDICKNVVGHEYDDADFFKRCGEIGKRVGFEWGGDWKNFPDRPHFQWSGVAHEFTSADIIAGHLPGIMPLYKDGLIKDEDEAINYLAQRGKINSPEYWHMALDVVFNLGALFIKWANDVKLQ